MNHFTSSDLLEKPHFISLILQPRFKNNSVIYIFCCIYCYVLEDNIKFVAHSNSCNDELFYNGCLQYRFPQIFTTWTIISARCPPYKSSMLKYRTFGKRN